MNQIPQKIQRIIDSIRRGEGVVVPVSLFKRHTPEFLEVVELARDGELKISKTGGGRYVIRKDLHEEGLLIGVMPGTLRGTEIKEDLVG